MDVQQVDYTAQALGSLANQYAGKPKLAARITAVMRLAQDLDSCVQAVADRMDVTTTTGVWLDICGALVGASRTLPNGDTLADGPYRILVLAKIARNHCTGDVPSMIAQLVRLFDPNNTGVDIWVTDLGKMAMQAQIGRLLTADEKSILALTSGASRIPGGILPKPSGVKLQIIERPETDFFCFSRASNPGVPLLTGGRGFSTASSPDGHWAGVV